MPFSLTVKTAFVCGMCRKIISFCFLFIFIFGFNGCKDSKENKEEMVRVATMSDSGEKIAAELFCNEIKGDVIEFSSSHDAVLALENGKADYVSLNEYDAHKFIEAQRNIAFYKNSGHNLEFRAIFNLENEGLCDEFNDAISKLEKAGVLTEIKEANIKGKVYKRPESNDYKGTLVMLCDPVFDNRVVYGADGELCGTDVEIAMAICEELGYNLEIRVEDFDLMFTELECGNADFIMSSAEYTEERAEHFLFSDIYSTYEYNLYTTKE